MRKKYFGFTLSKSKRYLTGFTIVEMIVVIAIIGILATLVTVNVVGAKQRANYTKVLADMDSIAKAARLYKEETGNWPIDEAEPNVSWGDTGIQLYMPTQPMPPCKPTWVVEQTGAGGWAYDWENWILLDGLDKIVRVSLQNHNMTNGANTVFFKCLDKGTSTLCKYSLDNPSAVPIDTVSSVTCK